MSGMWEIDKVRMEAVDELAGEMQDAELDELVEDLFAYGEYGTMDQAGPVMALSMWRAGEWPESDYRDAVRRFKSKWFQRSQKDRVEFYAAKLQERCDELKRELALDGCH